MSVNLLLTPNYYSLNTGSLYLNNTIHASDSSSGTLIVNGGVGIGQSLYVNTDCHVGGTIYATNIIYEESGVVPSTVDSSSTSTGSLTVAGGCGIAKNTYIGGNLNVLGNINGNLNISTIDSTNTSTGAFIIPGGLAVAKNTHLNTLYVDSTSNNALQIAGGLSVNGPIKINNLNVNGTLSASDIISALSTNNSLNTGSGSLVVAGGCGIAQDLRVGGTIYANSLIGSIDMTSSTIDSSSISTGSMIIGGGCGINGSLYAGGNINCSVFVGSGASINNLTVNNNSTISGSLVVNNGVSINSTVNSSDTNTGALNIVGGCSIGQNVNIGGNVNVSGSITSSGNIFSSLNLSSTVNSTSSSTGALTVAGGIGIGVNMVIGGAQGTSSTTTGALIVNGGVSIGQNLYVGGTINGSFSGNSNNITIIGTNNATSTSTGSLIVNSGCGISQDLIVGGKTDTNRLVMDGLLQTQNDAHHLLFGVFSYPTSVYTLESAMNITFDIINLYNSFGNISTFNSWYVTNVVPLLSTRQVLISINPNISGSGGYGNLADIAAGSFDTTYFKPIYDAIIQNGYTDKILISFFGECNDESGSRYYSVVNTGNSAGNSVASYISAFQHTVTYWRTNYEPTDQKLRFIHWLNTDDLQPSYNSQYYTVQNVYPGDAYVDICGFSDYNRTAGLWRSPGMNIQYYYEETTRVANCPFMICESGCMPSNDPSNPDPNNMYSKSAWLEQQIKVYSIYYTRVQCITFFLQSTTNDFTLTQSQEESVALSIRKSRAREITLDIPHQINNNLYPTPFPTSTSTFGTVACTLSIVSKVPNDLLGIGSTALKCQNQNVSSSAAANSKVYYADNFSIFQSDYPIILSFWAMSDTDNALLCYGFEDTGSSTATQMYYNKQLGQSNDWRYYFTWCNNPTPNGTGISRTPAFYMGSNTPGTNIYITGIKVEYADFPTPLMVPLSTETFGTTGASSTSTGALIVGGGVGIGQNLYVNGTINCTGNDTFNGTSTLSGIVNLTNTTTSSSYTTGSLLVSGGMGVTKNIYCNGIAYMPTLGNATSITNAGGSTSSSTGALIVSGGVGIAKSVNIGSASNSTSTSTGALFVTGGAGIGGDVHIGGELDIVGGFHANGAVGSFYGLQISSGGASTSTSNGALVVTGGAGISGDVHIGGELDIVGGFNAHNAVGSIYGLYITSGGASTSSSNGALVVTGGAGISGDLYVGGNINGNFIISSLSQLNITNTTISNNNSSGSLIINGGLGMNGSDLWCSNAHINSNGFKTDTDSTTCYWEPFLPSLPNQWNDIALCPYNESSLIRYRFSYDGMHVYGTSNASSSTTGSLILEGGAGIKGNLYVGGTINGNINNKSTYNCTWTYEGGQFNQDLIYTITGSNVQLTLSTASFTPSTNATTIFLFTPTPGVVNPTTTRNFSVIGINGSNYIQCYMQITSAYITITAYNTYSTTASSMSFDVCYII